VCWPSLAYGSRSEVANSGGRLSYWFEVTPIQPDAATVSAAASAKYWWGLGERVRRITLDAAVHISCDSQADECLARATLLGERSCARGPLRIAVLCEVDASGADVTATIEMGAALQGQTRPEISAGVPGVATAKMAWAGATEEAAVGMGRFAWRCHPRGSVGGP
jgi:hypothetical protein